MYYCVNWRLRYCSALKNNNWSDCFLFLHRFLFNQISIYYFWKILLYFYNILWHNCVVFQKFTILIPQSIMQIRFIAYGTMMSGEILNRIRMQMMRILKFFQLSGDLPGNYYWKNLSWKYLNLLDSYWYTIASWSCSFRIFLQIEINNFK